MADESVTGVVSRKQWQHWLVWALFALVVYQLRGFFFVAFITFLLCYLVRTIVEAISKRFSPADRHRVRLDQLLTLATFLVMSGILVGTALWIGPRFVQQSRALLARQQSFDPQAAFQSMLNRSVGPLLMRSKMGASDDDRYQSALQVYQENSQHGEQQDFELATRQQLTHEWWDNDPLAAALRQHASESLPQLASVVGERVGALVRNLLTLPTQLATALLLTLFICFDMLNLRESIGRLRDSRIGDFYNEIVPNLGVFSRLIGRSFSAQALIAVFNTLLTFLLLCLLGIENDLLLCLFVFIGSFIPVLGVLLSGIPIAIQAILQPDGSIKMACLAMAGILLIHLIETSFLSPRIVGKSLGLHPVVVLVILVVGEHFFGIWGLLLGVPVAVYFFRVVLLQEAIPGIYEPDSESKV